MLSRSECIRLMILALYGVTLPLLLASNFALNGFVKINLSGFLVLTAITAVAIATPLLWGITEIIPPPNLEEWLRRT